MSVTSATGFQAAGVVAGLKSTGKPDVALVVNDGPNFAAAAVCTSNRVFAAPVAWTRQVMGGEIKAVILNSGGANACTGQGGFEDSVATAEKVAVLTGCEPENVAVCSTGLIGIRLPMDKLLAGVENAAASLSSDGGAAAARAIMTTDSHPKTATRSGAGYVIGGMAKGAGMLAPGLATMLVTITTDALLANDELDQALRAATSVTFDRLDSDGCMSTNDTVILLSSGASGVTPELAEFTTVLTEVCDDLAKQLISDAEGASHDISITVTGAASLADAVEVAKTISRSNLFKCAIFGNDPNWGRVLSAVGTTKAAFDPAKLDVSFNGVPVCVAGAPGVDRSQVDLTPRAVQIDVNLHAGDQEATILTNDLTYDYVKENAEYSS